MKKIAILASIPFFIKAHLDQHIFYLAKKNYKITIITKTDSIINRYRNRKNIQIIHINFKRKISILNDILCLFKLFYIFIINRFDIIHSYTPKVGLLTSISSKLSFNKNRIHTFTGQHWINDKKYKKKLYMFFDWLIIKLNSNCYADSFSQITFLINKGICKENDIHVINNGSVGGVDFNTFNKELYNSSKIKHDLGISLNLKVIIFVGRVNKDKGIFNLINSIINLNTKSHKYCLLIIGPLDIKNSEEKENFYKIKKKYPNIIKYYNYSDNISKYLSVSDLFCLPSTREGFGTSVIEAAAMKVPVLVSDIYGLNEIVNKNNGYLLDNINEKEIETKIEYIFQDNNKKKLFIENLYKDIKDKYNSIDILSKLENNYLYLLNK